MTPAGPLIILSPPRSFSSVVSQMLGQHPQLYAAAENGLFFHEGMAQWHGTVADDLAFSRGARRTVADLMLGGADESTVREAADLLTQRAEEPTRTVTDALIAAAAPRVIVDKSPMAMTSRSSLDGIINRYPNALFLHLTRHPHEAVRSIIALILAKPSESSGQEAPVVAPLLWNFAHQGARRFLDDQPPEVWARVRGEDVVNQPIATLAPVLEKWGLRTDDEALAGLLHPERSVHAQHKELGGNGPDFLASPRLRPAPEPPEKLLPDGAVSSPALDRSIRSLAELFGYRVG